MAIAGAVCWGTGVFLVALMNWIRPGYGQAFLDGLASVYPCCQGEASLASVLILTGWALLDGAIGGLILALVYNMASGCQKKE